MVHGSASPNDPALATYWADRRRTSAPPPIDRATLRLLQAQNGQCLICRGLLLHADDSSSSPTEREQWARVTRRAITTRMITSRDRNVGRGAAPSHPLVLCCCMTVSLQSLLEPSCGESPHGRF